MSGNSGPTTSVRTVKVLVATLVVTFVVFIVLPLAASHFYYVYPIDSFCKSLTYGDTRERVISKGKSEGFFPWEWQGTENIWVFNHDKGPMFRLACSVDFKDGKVTGKAVVDAD